MAFNRGAYAGLLGWTVGRFDWLDSPDSKVNRYWRAIEDGSTYWVGKTIIGLWGPDAGTNVRPNRLINGGPLDAFDAGAGTQKFVPFFASEGTNLEQAKRKALWYFFGGGSRNMQLLHPKNAVTKSGKHKSGALSPSDQRRMLYYLMNRAPHVPFVSGTVGKSIQAQHYYDDALASFGNPALKEITLLQRQLSWVIGNSSIKSATGRRKAQVAMSKDVRSGVVKTSEMKPATEVGMYLMPDRVSTGAPSLASYALRGIATVSASAEVQDFIMDGNSKFTNGAWQDMVRSINAQMAKDFQEEVVHHMTRKRTRPSTPQGLVEATRNPRNRYPQ